MGDLKYTFQAVDKGYSTKQRSTQSSLSGPSTFVHAYQMAHLFSGFMGVPLLHA